MEEKQNDDVELNVTAPEKYPYIKRMLMALDAFLQKRVAAIGAVYFLAMLIAGIILFGNGLAVNASTGTLDSKPAVSNAWVYSMIGVLTFLFVLVIARVVSVKLSARLKKSVEIIEK